MEPKTKARAIGWVFLWRFPVLEPLLPASFSNAVIIRGRLFFFRANGRAGHTVHDTILCLFSDSDHTVAQIRTGV